MMTQTAVTHLLIEQDKIIGVQTNQGETIYCEQVIIASGAWSAQWSRWLNITLPVTPLHGQLLAFPQPARALRHIVFGDAAYTIPRGPEIIVGATKTELGFMLTVTEEGTDWLSTTAQRLLPSLVGAHIIRTWAGLRPRTPDNHPILGKLPGWHNVFIAAGHNSVGIILSALTGQCMAELLTTGQTPPIIRPYTMERFLPADQQHIPTA